MQWSVKVPYPLLIFSMVAHSHAPSNLAWLLARKSGSHLAGNSGNLSTEKRRPNIAPEKLCVIQTLVLSERDNRALWYRLQGLGYPGPRLHRAVLVFKQPTH